MTLEGKTPLKALFEVTGETEAPCDVVERLGDRLPGLGSSKNHAAAFPSHIHSAAVVLRNLLHEVILDRVSHVAHTKVQRLLVLVVNTLANNSHRLKSLIFLLKKGVIC